MRSSDVVKRWIQGISAHDLDQVAGCFAVGYEDEAPARRGEFVRGRDQVRQNFERFFTSMPDVHSELRGTIDQGDTVWMEWSMEGTRPDGTRMEFVGVNIFEVKNDSFVSGRIYTELIRDAGGLDAQIERMASG